MILGKGCFLQYCRSQFVLIDYMKGVTPIIQMKYMRGNMAIIHTASQRRSSSLFIVIQMKYMRGNMAIIHTASQR